MASRGPKSNFENFLDTVGYLADRSARGNGEGARDKINLENDLQYTTLTQLTTTTNNQNRLHPRSQPGCDKLTGRAAQGCTKSKTTID